MAHREFTDPEGIRWQAWDVIPSTAERRGTGERRFGHRDDRDRRTIEQFRVQLDDGMEQGWLVFESATTKRRLYPIPPGWETLADEQLAALCASSDPVTRPPRPPE